MSNLAILQSFSAAAGFGVAALCVVSPRLGPGSALLATFLLPAALASAVLAGAGQLGGATEVDGYRMAYALLVLAAPGGLVFSMTVAREGYRKELKNWRWGLVVVCAAAPLLVVLLYAVLPSLEGELMSDEFILLGPGGYLSASYLLFVSVLVLANLERTFRSAQEHIRWEFKFLVLGLAATFATFVYLASKVLLFSLSLSHLPHDTLQVFSAIFLFSCLLMTISWRRSSGRARVVVSQGVVYSSITFLTIGAYLLASSLIAQWAGTFVQPHIEAKPIIFLIFAVILAVILLSASFRHRVRYWVRRNVFSGRYDYRTFWMEATKRVQASDPPETAAAALAELVHQALGAMGVTVWLRGKDSGKLRLVAMRGLPSPSLEGEFEESLEKLSGLECPLSTDELALDPDFLGATRASLFVPLRSGDETVGLLTIGSDRSGRAFDSDAREFLRVLAGHAGGEFHKSALLADFVRVKEAEAFKSFSTFLLHDLKNFASTLSLIAQNAAQYHGNPEFQRDAFQSVFDTAEKMKRLCNSLRTFSGMEATNRRLDDLNRAIKQATTDFDAPLLDRLCLQLDELPLLMIDAVEVGRVVQNLVLNAEESISAEGTITVKTAIRDGKVELCVQDDGRGISKEFLENELFVPFHTTKSNGLGIGLFQSKRIMEAHGGSILLHSVEGEGTTVTATFPVPHESLESRSSISSREG